MRFSIYQESLIGGRKVNQDRMGYCYTRDALLMLLADGMGGHIQGEVAATIAMQTMSALFQEVAEPYVKKPEQFLEDGMFAAHREIHRYRAVNNLPETPRTTLVACLVQHGTALWAHVGDSRLYWMRRGQIVARTRDHSRVEALIAQGKLDPSERDTHPDRNKLFNCLGAPTIPMIDMGRPSVMQPGDVIMMCSDGLWAVLPEQALATAFGSRTVVRAVPELVHGAAALAGRNSDNVTAMAMMWEDDAGDGESGYDGSDGGMITTSLVPLGAVTTTIHAPRQADLEGADQFDDSEIEKAIAEIRAAIDKSSRLTPKD
jgi:serine/threonine protein phosphatase PrpC